MATPRNKPTKRTTANDKKAVKTVAHIQKTGTIKSRGGRPKTTAVQMTRDIRMNLMAHLYLSNTMTYDDIRVYMEENYGVVISSGQISHDFTDLRKKWKERALTDFNEVVTQEIAKLDHLERSAFDLINQGETEKFCKVMLATAKRRATLLGLNKPLEVNLNDKRKVAELSDSDLEKIATGKTDDNDTEEKPA